MEAGCRCRRGCRDRSGSSRRRRGVFPFEGDSRGVLGGGWFGWLGEILLSAGFGLIPKNYHQPLLIDGGFGRFLSPPLGSGK